MEGEEWGNGEGKVEEGEWTGKMDVESQMKERGRGKGKEGRLTWQALCRGLNSSIVRLLLSVASGLSTSPDCIMMLCCMWKNITQQNREIFI